MTRPGPIALLGAVLAAFPLMAGEATSGPTPERVAELERLVRQDCGSCHGLTLKGGLGPPLDARHLGAADADVLTTIILDGVPGTPMPPWWPLITEGEARWIAEYLLQAE